MTHIYTYIKDGISKVQLSQLISGIKQAANDGFNIAPAASTVAVKELSDGAYSDNFGALVLVYTAKGKGFDVKKRFAKLLDESIRTALGEVGEVKLIIKEQANDMIGLNGTLRCNDTQANTNYEES